MKLALRNRRPKQFIELMNIGLPKEILTIKRKLSRNQTRFFRVLGAIVWRQSFAISTITMLTNQDISAKNVRGIGQLGEQLGMFLSEPVSVEISIHLCRIVKFLLPLMLYLSYTQIPTLLVSMRKFLLVNH
jgi:hypothetical protein